MNRNLLKLLLINTAITSEYSQLEYNELSMDPLVNDCLMHMYFFMLLNENDPKKDEEYDKFKKLYHSFDKEKQEYIKKDFIKIINAQDENQKQYKKER